MKEPAKIISVWGSPHSGKTTIATKLALSLYDTYACRVIVLYPDLDVPTVPVLFPHLRAGESGSVGVALSAVETDTGQVLPQLMATKKRENLCFLGYRAGDNRFTYPRYSRAKADAVLNCLCELADYVIADCPSFPGGNLLAAAALERSEQILMLSTPDLSSKSFYASQLPYSSDGVLRRSGMNHVDGDVFSPTEEALAQLRNPAFCIPFSADVKEQSLSGKLWEQTKDKRFRRILAELAKGVVEYGNP